jgi:MFS family permease
MGPTAPDDPALSRALVQAARRLIPFLCVLYVFNILDRVNAGFARLTMEPDLCLGTTVLGLSVFDLAYGLFYVGYLIFEVPSNLLLPHVGARVWIARIVFFWGLVSCATLLVIDQFGFYFIRILLGVAEAGFFPGIVLYLTFWFPEKYRARMMAYFMIGVAISGIIGYPINGLIMDGMHEVWGLKGWQWLFLLEGVPSVLLGVATLWALTDRPGNAGWLSPEEREALTRRMHEEEEERKKKHKADHWAAMLDARVWLLIALYGTVATGANAGGAYFPKLIENGFPQLAKWQIGLLGSLPHVCALLAMTLWGAHSDRTGERRWHVGMAAAASAVGWAAATVPNPYLALAGLCLAQAGMMAMLPTFWTLPTAVLSGAAAAGGIALINSIANLGGLFGPSLLGLFGPWSMAAVMALGLPLAILVPRVKRSEP